MWECLGFTYKALHQTAPSQTKAHIVKLSYVNKKENGTAAAMLVLFHEQSKSCNTMPNNIAKMATRATCILTGIRWSYDAKFTLMVINYEVKTNNCKAGRQFIVAEAKVQSLRNKSRRWQTQTPPKHPSVAPNMDISKNQNRNSWLCWNRRTGVQIRWDNKI